MKRIFILTLIALVACISTPTPTISPLITPTPPVSLLITPTSPQPPVATPVIESVKPTPIPYGGYNLDFEPPFYNWQGQASVNLPQGWLPFWADVPPCRPGSAGCVFPCPLNCSSCGTDYGCFWAKPEWNWERIEAHPDHVYHGNTSLMMFTYGRMGLGGAYQKIIVNPGAQIVFSAWAHGWQCFNYDSCKSGLISDRPYKLNPQIGIDPTGGTVYTATTVVWSAPRETFDVWSRFVVTTTARGGVATLFVKFSPQFDYSRPNNNVYFDNASVILGQSPFELYFPVMKQ